MFELIVPTTEGPMAPSEVVGELTYSCYRFNRGDSPSTTPAQWALIFGEARTQAMEERLQAELVAKFTSVLAGCKVR